MKKCLLRLRSLIINHGIEQIIEIYKEILR